MRILTAGLAAGLFIAHAGMAMEGPPPTLNPYTVGSASGFTLLVNPSDMLGRGPADYRMTRDGRVIWEARLPFTLWEAAVTDDGRVAGYGYTHGWRGYADGGVPGDMGEFVVALLAPDGHVARRHTESREHSRFLHTPPNPLAKGLELQEELRRFTIRLEHPDVNARRELRRAYDLDAGDLVAALEMARPEIPRRERPAPGGEESASEALLSVKERSVVALQFPRGEPPHPLRGVAGFCFDAEGSLCALRTGEVPPALVLVAQDGAVLGELPLPLEVLPEHVAFAGPAALGPGRFVAAVSSRVVDGTARCFVADFGAGRIVELPVESPPIMALAGFEDGRFAGLTLRRKQYSSVHGLCFFGADGSLLWRLEKQGYGKRPEELLSPEDLARHGPDEIAVLDNIRRSIQLFDLSGRLRRFIDLEEAWGRRPRYPNHLCADPPDGFVVYDFQTEEPAIRLDAQGRIRKAVAPRHEDGRRFRVGQGVQVSPDGALWTSDGFSLLRLSEDGVVDRMLGQPLDLLALTHPGYVTVGPDDRIYVADARTKAVHVFDEHGAPLGVCQPDPVDVSEISHVFHAAATPDHDVYIQWHHEPEHVHFDANFKRRDRVTVDVERIGQHWSFVPAGGRCWIRAYRNVYLVQDLREVVRVVSRRADGRWLEYPQQLSVAPDGSCAVLARSWSNEASITTYDAEGEPRTTFALPPAWHFGGRLAFDGRKVLLRRGDDVHVFEADGRHAGRFAVAGGSSWSGPFVAAAGREWWFVDAPARRVYRFSAL